VNSERASRGLGTLAPNGALTNAAGGYARRLLELNALNHSADGTTMVDRVAAAGYTAGPPLGEVLWQSTGYLPPEQAVAAWMASPSHREVLLNPTYSLAGAACYFEQRAQVESRCVMDLAG